MEMTQEEKQRLRRQKKEAKNKIKYTIVFEDDNGTIEQRKEVENMMNDLELQSMYFQIRSLHEEIEEITEDDLRVQKRQEIESLQKQYDKEYAFLYPDRIATDKIVQDLQN